MDARPGGYATAESTPSLNVPSETELTIECWVNHDGDSDENAILVGKNQSEESGYMVSLLGTGEDVRIDFGMIWPNSSGWSVRSSSGVPAGTWTHVACVYDGQRQTIYIDGELDAQREDWNGEAMTGNSAPLRLGTSAAGNERFFSGQLDEVRLWETARTQIEIKETLFTTLAGDESDLLAYYRFDGDTTDSARSNDLELAGTAELVDTGAFPVPPTLYARAGNGSVDLSWTPRASPNTASAYRLYRGTRRDGRDAARVSEVSSGTTTATDRVQNEQLYFYWVTAVDADGTESALSPPAVAYPADRLSGTGLSFPGSNSYVTVGDRQRLDMPAETKLTIECWVNHDGDSDEDAVLLAKHRPEQNGYMLSLDGTGQGAAVRFGMIWPNSESWTLTSNNGLPAGEWTHVACVYDGNQQAIYIDGELDAKREDWNDESMDGNDAPLLLGTTVDRNERFFSGQLDEIRVWNTARTQEQIQETDGRELLGNERGLAAYWRTCDGRQLYSATGDAVTGELNNVSCGGTTVTFDETESSADEADNDTPDASTRPGTSGDNTTRPSTRPSANGTDAGIEEGTKGTVTRPSTSAAGSDQRGFFSNGGGGPLQFMNETMLTLVGIVFSIVGIVHQMIGGN